MSKLIVAVTQHLNLGTLLLPYLVKEKEDGVLEIEEQALASPPGDERTDVDREIMQTALSYSDRNLMKVFSKEKHTADFFRKMTDSLFSEHIRPFIEQKTQLMIRLITEHDIPLYLKEMGRKKLYPHHRVKIHRESLEIGYRFELSETAFRYTISCRLGGEPYALIDRKPALVLTGFPACIIAKDELLVCEELEASRLMPFFNKKTVEVPRALIRKYIDWIILPALQYSTVEEASGFEIIERHPERKAVLSLGNSVLEEPVLMLSFRYDDHSFEPEVRLRKKVVTMEEEGGQFRFFFFSRDIAWERECIGSLKSLGLQQFGNAQFRFQGKGEDKSIFAWIRTNHARLAERFELVQADTGKKYFLGDLKVTQVVSEQPDWFDLQITVDIGTFHYPFTQFRRYIMHGIREFLLPTGRIVLLPEEWFEKYNELLALGVEEGGHIRLQKAHFGLVEELEQAQGGKGPVSYYREKKRYPIPAAIKATLRSYQEEGFRWMLHLRENGFGGCLADDMGLGKTLQAITLLQALYPPEKKSRSSRQSPPSVDPTGQYLLFGEEKEALEEKALEPLRPASLIVVPTSLLPNWTKEIRKFSSLSVYEYTGTGRLRNKGIQRIFAHYNVVLTTYGLLRNDIELLSDYTFECIILDESQIIKNRTSVTYQSATRLKGKQRIVLTGTPIENSLNDLWAQFNFINPGMLGSYLKFQDLFVTPISKEKNVHSEARLQKLIRPFFLRRTKEQVAPELPTLTEEVVFCEMLPEQEQVYKKEKNALRNRLLDTDGEGINLLKNRFVALQGITRLRLLANHPQMLQSDYAFSSGKMERILEMYQILMEEGHKVLIFSSFVKYLQLLAGVFQEKGWKYAMLTGSTTNREEEINRFSDSPDLFAFLISLKAGGVGLNLTKADYVFIIDPWWNPAAEMQAVSRAHRIGQDKQVMVYRFITSDTIEEKIIRLQETKSKLAESFITTNNPLKALTDAEWSALLRQL